MDIFFEVPYTDNMVQNRCEEVPFQAQCTSPPRSTLESDAQSNHVISVTADAVLGVLAIGKTTKAQRGTRLCLTWTLRFMICLTSMHTGEKMAEVLAQGDTSIRKGERRTAATLDAEALASGRLGKCICKQ